MRRTFALGLLSVMSVGGLAEGAEPVTITDLAPKDTMLLLSADAWPQARKALDESGMGELWDEPSVKAFVGRLIDTEFGSGEVEEMMAWFEDLEIDLKDLGEPRGATGMAMYGVMTDGELRMEMLVHADFGDGAAELESDLETMLDDLMDRDEVEWDTEGHGDRDIHIVKLVEEDDDDAEEDMWAPEPSLMERMAAEGMYICRVDQHVLLASEMDHLKSAIDRIEGDRLESVGESRLYNEARAQHADDVHLFGAFMLPDVMRESIEADMAQEMMLPLPVGNPVEALGLLSFEAAGVGCVFDADDAMTEMTIGVLVPEKKGIFKLLGRAADGFDPPPFIGADTASVFRIAVQFSEVIGLVEKIAEGFPPELAGQMQAAMEFFKQNFGPVFRTMGPEVYIAQTYSRPLGAESMRQVIAIRATDALAVSNAIAPIAPMAAMEPRDFQGNQIFEDPTGQGIGIGFGYVFIGAVEDIENAMRQAGNPDGARLATEDRFARATGPLVGESVLASYSDMRQAIEYLYWQWNNMEAVWKAQLDAMGLDAEMREMMEDAGPATPEWVDSLPPMDLLLKYLGDSVFEIEPTPDGYRGRSLILRPDAAG